MPSRPRYGDVRNNHQIAGLDEPLQFDMNLVERVEVRLKDAEDLRYSLVDACVGTPRRRPIHRHNGVNPPKGPNIAAVICGDRASHHLDAGFRHVTLARIRGRGRGVASTTPVVETW
jgi:hypothetical protein